VASEGVCVQRPHSRRRIIPRPAPHAIGSGGGQTGPEPGIGDDLFDCRRERGGISGGDEQPGVANDLGKCPGIRRDHGYAERHRFESGQSKSFGPRRQYEKERTFVDGSPLRVRHVAEMPDTTPPSIAIITPTDGAEVAGPTTIVADPTDDLAVGRVVFTIAGDVFEVAPGPWQLVWDAGAVPDGDYTIEARAYDLADNPSAPASITVTVRATADDAGCGCRGAGGGGGIAPVLLVALAVLRRRRR